MATETTGTKNTEAALRLKVQEANAAVVRACNAGDKSAIAETLKVANDASKELHNKMFGRFEKMKRDLGIE